GGDGQHGAAGAGRDPALAQGQRHVDGPVQHDSEHGVERSVRQPLGGRDEVAGGVVHQDVDRAEPLVGGVDDLLDRCRVADVEAHGEDLAAGLLGELASRRLQHLEATARDDGPRPQFQEAPGHGATQPGATACDENDLVGKQARYEHDAMLPRTSTMVWGCSGTHGRTSRDTGLVMRARTRRLLPVCLRVGPGLVAVSLVLLCAGLGGVAQAQSAVVRVLLAQQPDVIVEVDGAHTGRIDGARAFRTPAGLTWPVFAVGDTLYVDGAPVGSMLDLEPEGDPFLFAGHRYRG